MTFAIQPVLRKILFFLAILISGFKGFSQNKLITLHVKNKPISLIIKSIEEQTDFRIIYNARKIDADQLGDLDVNNASLETALKQLLKDKNISFYIQKKQVLLTSSTPDSSNSDVQETERFITGTVYNAKDKLPLPGASIRIKGTGMGAVTDFNGKFVYQLKGNNIPNLVLEVGFLGMEPQSQKAENKKDFTFFLQETTDELNPVVITSSYGTEKLKEEIVGSISTITAKDIPVQQASESIDKMLEGQIAGVLIENTSGVGGPVKINIRGQGTLTPINGNITGTSTQPLIIVDGIIMSEETFIDSSFFNGRTSFSESLSNPLAQIAPENIESFTVLKDAAAVGIYGADGANGVILITTKKGKVGKAKFGFSNQLGVSSAINQIKYLNGEQYTEVRNAYLKGTSSTALISYNGVNTDWFNLLNTTGIYNKYNFNVSGADSKFSYRTNISYLDIDEPQLGNKTKQLNAGINLGYKLSKLDVNLFLNPSYIQKTAPNIYYSFAYLPTTAPYNADGSYTLTGVTGINGGNPLAAIAQNKNETNTYGLLGSLNLNYKLNDVFKFSTLFGIDYKDKDQDRYFSGENESGRTSGSFVLDGISYPNWGRRSINDRKSTKWNWQGQMLFNKEINKNHGIDGVIGFELAEEKGKFSYMSGTGFINPNVINPVSNALQDDNIDTPTVDERRKKQTYEYDISNSSRVSLFSQINYNYKKRYFFLGNFRRDESSVFGDDTNVALNSGAGLAWIASNENFLKSNSWIDFLKLKVSYGSTGNSRIGSYRSKGLYNFDQNGYNGENYAVPSDAPNGNLSWEKNKKFNTGIDFNVFNTIEMTLEYYYDDLSDLIVSREIPAENGYTSVELNAADMYNKGFEFTTRFKWFQKGKFKWSTSFNIATLKNKITDLKGLGDEYSTANLAIAQKIGYSTSTIWGVNWVGVDPATGRDMIKKNGQVYDAATYNKLFTNADWEPIGNTQPKAFGGFSNRISYKDITFSITGAYQWGGDKLVTDVIVAKYSNTINRNLSVNAIDYWKNPGDIVTQPAPGNNTLISNMSKYVYDATYIKISNINLSYNVPLKNAFLDALTVFGDVSNALYWYKEKSPKGMNGIREFSYTYPQARTISMGINAKF
ncbi:SusC/RagA family TonB-linked outer membrane protein [Flavobacterium johnsoniae]|uniref:TonB-linked outer membrane protein, SusC/RagA family n=1 Tax=Flavobacterium johnsoniae TaxID=986 RepID=A0A1M5MP14_FLAJO|nr:SusC/RagA family TonB-linked outer membrane protein [Flavobacterium johnsoniae]SHG79164.1 TonB-linked outer membrane protein, SusC/RagA family [Flavobacterium johnsoniae]